MTAEKNMLPLTEATYLILLSLTEPLHGYGIMQKIADLSGNRVQMGPGTLYGGLSSLVRKNIIRRIENKDSSENRKKLYEITPLGHEMLENEYRRLNQLVSIGHEILEKRKNNEKNN